MRRISLLLIPALLVACSGREPMGPKLNPSFDEGGNSGCATVHFIWAGTVPPYTAALSGDLEGTMTLSFTAGSNVFAGVTQKNYGTASWDVTGGVLGPLQFVTEFENKNFWTDRPGSPLYLFENIGTHRALQGVEKANLHYIGTFDGLARYGEHHYTGIICP